ncbi:MAG: hypothetical protein IJT91_05670 [Clostridia bacterium]|nr:hypothetical protein [Clostridia bacterium]
MNAENQNNDFLLDVLFYISAEEMLKDEREINSRLILVCAKEAGEIDPRYASTERERAEFAASVIEKADLRSAEGKKPRAGRLSKRTIAILIAAAVLIVTALAAAAVATDVFGLFFKDPKEILEWEDGESRKIDGYEMIISSEGKEYSSVEELIRDFGDKFIIPSAPPEGYEVAEINYLALEARREITVKYINEGNTIQYTVMPDRERPTVHDLNSSGYETIETRGGNLFYLMESSVGYQAVARIGNEVYTVDSTDREDLIRFIKNSEEL